MTTEQKVCACGKAVHDVMVRFNTLNKNLTLAKQKWVILNSVDSLLKSDRGLKSVNKYCLMDIKGISLRIRFIKKQLDRNAREAAKKSLQNAYNIFVDNLRKCSKSKSKHLKR